MRFVFEILLLAACSGDSLTCGPGTHQEGHQCLPDLPDLAAAGVGSAAACLVGGKVVLLDGEGGDYIHPGKTTITGATWTATTSPGGDTPMKVAVHLVPTQPSEGAWWDLVFSTQYLNLPMATQVYEDAMREAFTDAGHPGLEVTGDGRACNTLIGRFQIEDLRMQAGALQSFTATFEQECEGSTGLLRGCLHYQP